MFSMSGADVLIENGAMLHVLNNMADLGGGMYLESESSTLTATGNGTRMTVEKNTARFNGGGVCSMSGADVL